MLAGHLYIFFGKLTTISFKTANHPMNIFSIIFPRIFSTSSNILCIFLIYFIVSLNRMKASWRQDFSLFCFLWYSSQKLEQCLAHVRACLLSCFNSVQLFATLWTVAAQDPLSLGFSRQEYWSWLPSPSPGDLSNPGSNPCISYFLHWQAGSLPLELPGKPLTHSSCLVNIWWMSTESEDSR